MEHSNYCAAYELKQLREYPSWTEKPENARKEKKEVDGKEVEVQLELTDDSIVYVHDSYIVTADVYKDTNLLFDDVTDAWKEFCHSQLGFEIPVYEPIEIQAASEPAEEPVAQTSGEAGT